MDTTHAVCAVVAHDLVKVYGDGATGVRALDRVSLRFARGGFTAIMGPSGSGKTTLLHCLAGLDAVTSGRVTVGGTDITALSDRQLTAVRRDRIGFVFQSYNLLPQLTAGRNITLPLDLAGRPVDRKLFAHVVAVLGLGDRLGHRPGELSGGQQQRVALARALVSRPEVVFADEPTGNLDSRSGAEVLGFLRASVREFGQTVVMVTHDAAAAAVADRVVLVADGRVVDDLSEPTHDAVARSLRSLAGAR
jgi:putative ABC transport system ATP-binding protein